MSYHLHSASSKSREAAQAVQRLQGPGQGQPVCPGPECSTHITTGTDAPHPRPGAGAPRYLPSLLGDRRQLSSFAQTVTPQGHILLHQGSGGSAKLSDWPRVTQQGSWDGLEPAPKLQGCQVRCSSSSAGLPSPPEGGLWSPPPPTAGGALPFSPHRKLWAAAVPRQPGLPSPGLFGAQLTPVPLPTGSRAPASGRESQVCQGCSYPSSRPAFPGRRSQGCLKPGGPAFRSTAGSCQVGDWCQSPHKAGGPGPLSKSPGGQ